MKKYQPDDIFVPGGMPELTYNPRDSLNLEKKLLLYKKKSYKLIYITGRTKSGKTVLVKKIFPRDDFKPKVIWFDGGTFENELEFWNEICEQLNIYTTISKTTGKSATIGGEIETEGKVGFLGIFAAIKAKLQSTKGLNKNNTITRSNSPKNIVIKTLRKKNIPFIIDDFHYIPKEDQKKIIRAIKALIFEGKIIIFISIPHRKYDIIKAERELTGRVEQIPIPYWDIHELVNIGNKGFPYLNMSVDDKLIKKMAEQALGSPHLMQEFCLQFCKINNIGLTCRKLQIYKYPIELNNLYENVAENTGRPIYERLKKGPRQRADRIRRTLKNGKTTDIYGVILFALAKMTPGMITISYEEIRSSIKKIIRTTAPQANEISRVLEYMSKISISDNSSAPVIDWDKEEGLLHITDPFFAFFLRWGKID